jgi:hypothetical protein
MFKRLEVPGIKMLPVVWMFQPMTIALLPQLHEHLETIARDARIDRRRESETFVRKELRESASILVLETTRLAPAFLHLEAGCELMARSLLAL